MAQLFTNPLAPTAAAASSQASANFPASNALTQSIARPWKSASLIAEYLEIDLGADNLIRGVLVHGANFTAMRVDTINNAAVTTAGGADILAANRSGRVRGVSSKNITGRRVRVYPSGATTDGGSGWSIGAVHVFGAVASLPQIEYEQNVVTNEPAIVNPLPNGRMAAATVGADLDTISLPFVLGDSQNISPLIQNARNGVCGLDLQLSNYPAAIWPVIRMPGAQKLVYPQRKWTKESVDLLEYC